MDIILKLEKWISYWTRNERDVEYLYVKRHDLVKISVVEKLLSFSYGLYYTYISATEAYVIVNQKFTNHNKFVVDMTGWAILGL